MTYDYNKLDRNYPEPKVPRWFDKKLAKIGDRTPLGSRLRRVWGCRELWFRLDEMRLKYQIGSTFSQTVKKDPDTGMLYDAIFEEPIGLPRHIIEVWLPPSYFGSKGLGQGMDNFKLDKFGNASYAKEDMELWESLWNEHRYEFIGTSGITLEGLQKDYSQGKNVKEILDMAGAKLVDVLGAFPRNGEYRHFYTIEGDEGEYKDPTEEDLEFIRAAYHTAYETPYDAEEEVRQLGTGREQRERAFLEELFDKGQLNKEAAELEKRKVIFDLAGKSNAIHQIHQAAKQCQFGTACEIRK